MKRETIKKSYGVACCRLNNKTHKVEVLMIHKRTTYSFVDFALGRYKKDDDNHLLYLFNHMTTEEKLDIWSLDFGRMWFRIWLVDPDSIHTSDNLKLSTERYEKYNICKKIFINNFAKDKGIKIHSLLSKSNNIEMTSWELPKGRLSSPNERILNCAIREFQEETNIPLSEYEILEDEPYTCSVRNGKICYVNNYFLALIHSNSKFNNPYEIKLNYNTSQQISEVIGIQWMDLDKIKTIDLNNRFCLQLKTMYKSLRKNHKLHKMAELKII
jgi:8-oxo-dGTP pyrophosphatase MutT (NUDIX family)